MTERPDPADDTLLVLLYSERRLLAQICAALGISEAKARAYLERVREGREGADGSRHQSG